MKSWDDPQCETPSRPIPAFHRATIAVQIEEALTALLAAEQAVLEATQILTTARRALQRREDTLLVAEALTGKNAESRAAQLRGACCTELAAVEWAEDIHRREVNALEGARATFSAQKVLARLLAGEDR